MAIAPHALDEMLRGMGVRCAWGSRWAGLGPRFTQAGIASLRVRFCAGPGSFFRHF